MSSGRFGAEIVREALLSGDQVHHLYAKNSRTPFNKLVDVTKNLEDIKDCLDLAALYKEVGHRYNSYVYQTFDEYHITFNEILHVQQPEIIIAAAAVSDYGSNQHKGKISSDKDYLSFSLKKLPKVIQKVKKNWPTTYLVAFKLLSNVSVEELISIAAASEKANQANLVVANDLRDIRNGKHKLYLVQNQKVVKTLQDQSTLAKDLWNFIVTDCRKDY